MDPSSGDSSSSSGMRRLEIKHNELSYTFSIPERLYDHAAELRDTFTPTTSADIFSTPQLALSFIDCAASASSSEADAQLSQHLWQEFDQHIVNNNDIHVLATSLDSSEEEKLRLI